MTSNEPVSNRSRIVTSLLWLFGVGVGLSLIITPLSNWLGQYWLDENTIKGLKDSLIYLSTAGLLVAALIMQRSQLAAQLKRPLNLLVIGYTLLNLLYLLLLSNDSTAELVALNFNLRMFAVFAGAQLVVILRPELAEVKQVVARLRWVLWPIVVVAVLQALVLPADFLTWLGYSYDGAFNYLSLDSNPDLLRVQSTLRGPNELGALIALGLVGLAWLRTQGQWLKADWLLVAVSLVALYFSYSRSGQLVLVAGLVMLVGLNWWRKVDWRHWLAAAVAALLAALVFFSSETAQQVILHTELDDLGTGADMRRMGQWLLATVLVVTTPLGLGLGTAGPASMFGPAALITENYYLQQFIELGWLGGLLFLAIIGWALWRLLAKAGQPEAKLLLVMLLMLSAINLVLHGWADDATSFVFWGLFGLWFARRDGARDMISS